MALQWKLGGEVLTVFHLRSESLVSFFHISILFHWRRCCNMFTCLPLPILCTEPETNGAGRLPSWVRRRCERGLGSTCSTEAWSSLSTSKTSWLTGTKSWCRLGLNARCLRHTKTWLLLGRYLNRWGWSCSSAKSNRTATETHRAAPKPIRHILVVLTSRTWAWSVCCWSPINLSLERGASGGLGLYWTLGRVTESLLIWTLHFWLFLIWILK